MPLYRPKDLQEALKKLGTGAKKSLSQNFLIDGNIVRKIANAVPFKEQDQIIEIGPGPGALTEVLLDTYHPHYIGIEKDTLFVQHLRSYFENYNHTEFIEGDFLKTACESFLKDKPTHFVGNLPYRLTSPILERVTSWAPSILSATFMVQDEVAKRIIASSGNKDYGLLSIGIQLHFEATYLFKVSSKSFLPAPKVQSAVVQLIPKKPPKDLDIPLFLKFIRIGFQKRRKSLRSSFKDYGTITDFLAPLGKPELSRPEELSIEEWIHIFTEAKKAWNLEFLSKDPS